jgi:hypothetical protein
LPHWKKTTLHPTTKATTIQKPDGEIIIIDREPVSTTIAIDQCSSQHGKSK